jgi:hypothetical protein
MRCATTNLKVRLFVSSYRKYGIVFYELQHYLELSPDARPGIRI